MTSKLNRKMGCGWQEHDHVHHHHQCFVLMTMNMFMVNIIILPWPWTERARGNKSRQGWGKEETATMGGGGSRCSSFKLAFFIYIRGSGARNFKFCLFFYIRVNLFHFCLKDGGEKSTRYFLSIPQEVLRDEGLLSKYAGKPKQQEVQSFIYEGEANQEPPIMVLNEKLTKCIAWGCLHSKEEKLLWRFAALMAFYWKLLDVKKIDYNFLFLHSSLFKLVSEEFIIDGILLRFWEIIFFVTILLGCWTWT